MNLIKKLCAAMLALTMLLSLAACAKDETPDAPNADPEQPELVDSSAISVLETVWSAIDDANKFPVWGGDYNTQTEDAPGAMDISDAATVEQLTVLPQDKLALADEAASLFHMMNTNSFTAAAFHLTDRETAADVAQAVRDAVQEKHWMCGFPEQLVVYSVNGCVVYAYGLTDNIDNFSAALTAQYPAAEQLFNEPVQA